MGFKHWAVVASCAVVLGGGCTSMLVDDRPIRDRHVVAGRVGTGGEITFDELHFTGSFVSTTPHLEPLRAVLDEHLGGEVVLIGTNAGRFTPLPAGAVSFFDGTTATGSVNPGLSLTGTSFEPAYHDRFQINVFALPAELTAFTGTVNPLLAIGGIAPIPAPAIPLPPLNALDVLLDGLSFQLAGARADVRGGVLAASWQVPVAPEVAGVPVLELTIRLDTRESVEPYLFLAIALDVPTITVRVRIQPNVCSIGGGRPFGAPACRVANQVNGSFVNYDGAGGAAAADNVNVDVTVGAGAASFDGHIAAATTPLCPLVPGLTPIVCASLSAVSVAVQGQEAAIAAGVGGVIPGILNGQMGGLPPIVFPFTPVGGVPVVVDLGQTALAVAADAVNPAFTAPFGAAGGQWSTTSLAGLSRGAVLCPTPGTPACLLPALPGIIPVTIAPAPSLTPILGSAPFVAHETRALFSGPVVSQVTTPRPPAFPGAVPSPTTVATVPRFYSITTTTDPDTGATAAFFGFRLDLDGDGLRDSEDSCIDVPDSGVNADADSLDDACDLCIGVASASRADRDRDGAGDACDCDVENDGCVDRTTDPRTGASCGGGAVLDRSPFASGSDTDGDAIPDDCDPDSDNDGVLDENDNCPLTVNPDQTDSGGLRDGDACDVLCPSPGAPGCAFDPGRSGFSGGGFREFDFVPGGLEPLCRSSSDGCFDLVDVGRCLSGGPDCFDILTSWNPSTLNLGREMLATNAAGAIASVGRLGDLDGDGLNELVVGMPRADGCQGNTCFARAGQVVVVSSIDDSVLYRFDGPTRGARLGMSVVGFDRFVAIGAPGARNATNRRAGGVFVYDMGHQPPRLVGSFYGTERKDKMGRALSLAGDRDGDGLPELLASAPGARGRAGREAGRVEARTFYGRLVQTFEGPTARARLGDDSSVLLSRQQSPAGVMVGASREGRGGAVIFYGWDGRQQWLVRGARGAELGASLAPAADFDRDGRFEVAVGAPGASRGAGAVLMIDATGRTLGELIVPGVRRLGASVGLPGDIDGDGRTDLSVSFEQGTDRSLGSFIVRQAGQTPPPPTDGPL